VEEALKCLNNNPIPNFNWKAIPPAVPERKFDVSQRVEELRKYLDENTYPTHQKNIMALIEMYNRKELPRPDTDVVHIRDGKLTEVTIEHYLDTEPIWIEVRFKTTG